MRHMVVPLGSCLPTGFFPVLRTLRKHLGRRDGIANQRGLFQSVSSWCCWSVSDLASTSRACVGSGGRNYYWWSPCPTRNFRRGWLVQPRPLYGPQFEIGKDTCPRGDPSADLPPARSEAFAHSSEALLFGSRYSDRRRLASATTKTPTHHDRRQTFGRRPDADNQTRSGIRASRLG
jgi:hypothetical protein